MWAFGVLNLYVTHGNNVPALDRATGREKGLSVTFWNLSSIIFRLQNRIAGDDDQLFAIDEEEVGEHTHPRVVPTVIPDMKDDHPEKVR